MKLDRGRRASNPARVLFNFFLILLAATVGVCLFLFFEGKKPSVDLSAVPASIGKKGTFDIEVADVGSGLRHIEVTATQGNVVKELYSATNPRRGYTGQIGPLQEHRKIVFDADALGFTEGQVQLAVTAYDFSLRGFFKGNSVTAKKDVAIDTKPPVLKILHSELYLSPGGTGIAIYEVEEADTKNGVVLNGMFNPGHPLGGETKNTYIAYFALPYDAKSISESRIIATDVAGNSAVVPFSTTFRAARQKHDRITVSDSFLAAKIPEFEQYNPGLTGTPVEKYLHINQSVRKENNSKIAELCGKSGGERLWQGRFQRMPGSGRSGYADHRTYLYNGEAIDEEVHLGIDIASTQQADVTAANRGRVIFAGYLGIYGNMVILDHGQGVFSLYSHLSRIATKVGDLLSTGDSLGQTGTTGMAGGDHLHFSMVINGIFATPIEWWDPHWIEVTIDQPLGALK